MAKKRVNDALFAKIKGNLSKGGSKNIKFEIGKTYVVRLLPNMKDPDNSILHYYYHGWESRATGEYKMVVSPTTWGKKDPIPSHRFRLANSEIPEDKESANLLTRRQAWLVNVYVVEDPSTPENVGKIKVLRMGKQLYKIVKDALDGDDEAEFGMKVFDLTPDGVNLKIKVEEQGAGKNKYPTYVSSRFTNSCKVPEMTDEKIDETYDSVFDLKDEITVLSYDELVKHLDEHFFVDTDASEPAKSTSKKSQKSQKSKVTDDEDEIDTHIPHDDVEDDDDDEIDTSISDDDLDDIIDDDDEDDV
jgi:hypothetical protein